MHQLRVRLFLVALAAAPCVLPLCGGALRPAAAQTQPTQKQAVSGVVVDALGQPVAGATIVLLPSVLINGKRLPTLLLRGDSMGRFAGEVEVPQQPKDAPEENPGIAAPEAAAPAPWGAQVLVYAPGYAPRRTQLLAGNNKLVLEQGTVASGLVKDEKGQPVPGARVRVQYFRLSEGSDELSRFLSFVNLDELPPDNPVVRGFEALTDAKGTWTLRDLPLGSGVYVKLADPRFVTKSVQVAVSEAGGETPPAAPDLVAAPGATVSGRVLFPDGKPVADALVGAQVEVAERGYAETRSAPDGTFSLLGLPAGTAKLQVAPPSEEWAPSGVSSLTLTTTGVLRAPDITLTRGIAISGTISDAETKLPLAGARVIADGPFGSATSTPSDAQGRYTVRTPAGAIRFYVFDRPRDYLREMGSGQITQPVAPASTAAPDFALRRGVTLRGTALDEAGQPAVGATIASGSLFEGATTVVDAKGAWTLRGVDPRPSRFGGNPRGSNGTLTLQSSGAWEIASGARVSVATTTPVALTLRRVTLQDVTARVTALDGTPLAGIPVRISILFDPARGARRFQQAVTNARGEVVLRNLRPEESAEITPTKEGYTLVKAGVVAALNAKTAGARATDAVLTALNVTVRGRVVNANGTAVADARVAPIFPNDLRLYPLSATDADGQFALEKLQGGALTLGAAFGRQWGRLEVTPAKDTAAAGQPTITLGAPEPVVPGRALNATFEFLDEWKAEGGKQSYEWGQMVAQFAVLDPDRALQLLKRADGSVESTSFTTALYELLERDPLRAKAWAEIYLDRLDDTRNTGSLWLSIAVATIDADPTGARKIYDRFAPGVVADKTGLSELRQYALLGALAGRLGLPDASKWQTSLDAAFAKLSADDQAFRVGSYVDAAAQADLPDAEKMLAKMSPALRVRALEEMIPTVAKRDLPAAQRLLEQMEVLVAQPGLPVPEDRNDAMYRPTPTQSVNKARDAIVFGLLKTDPQAAYEQAKKVTEDGYGRTARRAEIASRLPVAQAVPILLREFEAARTSRYGDSSGEMARIAALIMPLDAKQGEAMFAQARPLLKPESRFGDMEDFGPRTTAFAFYRAPFDPAESRLLLENEWRRFYEKLRLGREKALKAGLSPNQDAMSNTYEQMIQDVVWAMVPVSLDRAAEMQQELSVLKARSGFYRNNVVTWLLSTDAARARLSFRNPVAE